MKFSVGELVILQKATYFSEWDGAIGQIVGPLKLRCCRDMHTMQTEWHKRYSVLPLAEGAFEVYCHENQLRKLNDTEQSSVTTRNMAVQS